MENENRLTVGELRKRIAKLPDDAEIITSADAEGNDYFYVWKESTEVWGQVKDRKLVMFPVERVPEKVIDEALKGFA